MFRLQNNLVKEVFHPSIGFVDFIVTCILIENKPGTALAGAISNPSLEKNEILHLSCKFLIKHGILASFLQDDKLEYQSCKNLARPCKSCKTTNEL